MATFEGLLKDIHSRKFAPIYLLHGEEPYFIDQIGDALEHFVLSEAERSFNQTILYGRDVEAHTLLDYLRRYPMMSQYQVVILREAQEMKSFAELLPYVSNPVPSTIFVVQYKHKKVDARTKIGKAFTEKGEVLEAKPLYDNQIPDWISQYAQSKNLKCAPQTALLLSEYLGTELGKISNEIDKLALNLAPGATITPENVQKYVGISKDYNIFELQKAVAARDLPKIARIQHHFVNNIKKNPLIPTIISLHGFFAKTLIVQEMLTARAPDQAIVAELKVKNEWFIRDYKLAARNFSKAKIIEIFGVLADYDLRSKGVNNDGTSTGEEELLKEMIFKIM